MKSFMVPAEHHAAVQRVLRLGRSGEAAALPELIAEWLASHGVRYRYDAKFRIIGEFQIRPDFYLPEVDVYIEYWGMDTPQYKMSMYKKQLLYQQEGKRLVSVYPQDLPRLDQHLRSKLSLFGVVVGERSESAATE